MLSDFQAIFCLGYQRVKEKLNDTAPTSSDFGGDTHAWQQFELILFGTFVVVQFNLSFVNEAFLVVLNSIGANIFNCPLQVAVTLEWIGSDFDDHALARFNKADVLIVQRRINIERHFFWYNLRQLLHGIHLAANCFHRQRQYRTIDGRSDDSLRQSLFGFDQIIFQFNNSFFRRDDLVIKSAVGFGSLGLRLILHLSERRLRLQ